jgi:TetR/AcrR family fatty acid metabolism transcriptional regulator
MMPPRSKEEVVQEFRIQSIQEAAMRVIARKGMAAATMQEIAEEAGVAKGTIYLYFRDRDELVEKTFENAIRELINRTETAMATGKPFRERLRDALMAKVAFFQENREFFRLYIDLRFPEGNAQQQRRHRNKCEPQYRTAIDGFTAQIQSAIDSGEIRKTDARRLAIYIVEGTNAIVIDRVVNESNPTAEDDVDFMVDLVFSGIEPRS